VAVLYSITIIQVYPVTLMEVGLAMLIKELWAEISGCHGKQYDDTDCLLEYYTVQSR
jgi:hypothetical protein